MESAVCKLQPTFCSYKKLAIFTTNVHTKNECLINHKTVIRSTEPPIFCRCCYRLAFFSGVGYNHFYVVCYCHLSSASEVGDGFYTHCPIPSLHGFGRGLLVNESCFESNILFCFSLLIRSFRKHHVFCSRGS